jgi:hypothetical protein
VPKGSLDRGLHARIGSLRAELIPLESRFQLALRDEEHRVQEPDIPVPIPASLYSRIEAALGRLGYPNVETFVIDAVRHALASRDAGTQPTPEEEAQIVERLRRLGYID